MTKTHKIDASAKHLDEFLSWLLSRQRQVDMPGAGRSFRRRTSRFWELWPLPPIVDEIHHVIHVDGIYLGRKAVVLIARNETHVLGWYLARSENSKAWSALMDRIAPPDVVVTDGGSGFAKAKRLSWPDTEVQRCVFHAFNQIKKGTTTRPRLPAGREFYALGKRLLHLHSQDDVHHWIADYVQWCLRWEDFLNERTWIDNRHVLTHERLVRAQRGINRLLHQGTLFTYLDTDLLLDGVIPATNNRIEGGTNAPLRAMLRDHRGMSLMRRIKAIFWWCYRNSEFPLPAAEILKVMPTDAYIEQAYRQLAPFEQRTASIELWGDAIAWHELHTADAFKTDWD